MARCEKCGKESNVCCVTAFGDTRCEDCLIDHLMTDRGKVEYMISLCQGEASMDEYDADYLGHIVSCWKKYRGELVLSPKDFNWIETRARELGLLD
jgi:hypothetical protein